MIQLKWAGVPTGHVPQIAKVVRTLSNTRFWHADFGGMDLSRQDLSGTTFKECCFHGTDLRGVRISSTTDFDACDLVDALGAKELIARIELAQQPISPEERMDAIMRERGEGPLPPTLMEVWRKEKADAEKAAAAAPSPEPEKK
jgi:hypothetical protein